MFFSFLLIYQLEFFYVEELSPYLPTPPDPDYAVFKIYFNFRQMGREGEREGERNINVWLPLMHPLLGTWPTTQACALDWELNQQPLGSQASTQSTEPQQPGQKNRYL